MLGILLIYFVGKKFYNLANDNNRSPWLYAILSVVVYYGMILVSAFIFGIILGLNGIAITSGVQMGFSFLSIIVGVLFVLIFYKILSSIWSKNPKRKDNTDILDQE